VARNESEIRTGPLVQEIRIAAKPEMVFQFFTDPDKVIRWKGRAAQLDPRPGGIYRVEINDRAVAKGEYVELDPPRRVTFTWGWEGGGPVPPGATTVEVDLEPDGDGTLLRLTHRDLPEEEIPQHADGWGHFLPRLATAAAGGDPGPDPMSQG
jgi:uncharacterized protein YndB with AHSA1/START domain